MKSLPHYVCGGIMETLKSFVCGQWLVGQAPFATLMNPSTEAVIAQASTNGVDLVAALAFGRDVGGKSLRAMTFAERGALLKRMSNVLHEAREQLIDASVENNGATRSDGKFDVDGAIGTLAYYAKLGETLGARTNLVEGAAEPLTRAPRFAGYHLWSSRTGVALHINAFNFPAWGMAEKAACAILAGMPIISKPATSTALVAARAMQLWVDKAEVPQGVVQFVAGSVGNLMDHLLPEDVVAFTGSADTGAKLRGSKAVVERSVRINIEADSLNAAVLGDDVEVGSDTFHLFIRHVTTEMTQKAGQKCTATRRIFVPKAKIEDVKQALQERLDAIRVGIPGTEGVDMGPLATAQQYKDAHTGLQALQADGARIVVGSSENPVGKGFFLKPVLLQNDNPHAARTVHAIEVFGPVSTLMPHNGAADAAALVARGEGTLVSSLYTDDAAFMDTMLQLAATWTGRMLIGSAKVADQTITPGTVLPSCVHGGPGRAGGGEELGGERGLRFYMQRTAVQGDRAVLDRVLNVKPVA
jgi:3,4-dehydroadipyl-CoA semialdehyde dehydrogenase